MKKLIIALLIGIGCWQMTAAQSFNNEWIDYNKAYYKFSIGRNGIYRIDQATLASIGLGGTPVEQLQLWRNGRQVAIFTSASGGPLPAGGFVEFFGKANDGENDKNLYRWANYQLSDQISLLTDTAAFFLTTEANTGQNLRYNQAPNNVAGNTQPKEEWFWWDRRIQYRDQINRGEANTFYGESIYSSSYDKGELMTSADINASNPLSEQLGNLNVFPGGPAATLSAALVGQTVLGYNRRVLVGLNGSNLINQPLLRYETGVFSATVPLASLSTATNAVQFSINSPEANDRYACHYLNIRYPRNFNFSGLSYLEFSLPASATGQYLEITNFQSSDPPVLYDQANARRYTAVVTGGVVRFKLLPASLPASLVLVSSNAGVVQAVASLRSMQFVNYAPAAMQGNYLIISSQLLAGTPNQLEAYRSYRSSAQGGGYNAKLYDVDQLVDQFGWGIKKNPLAMRNFVRWARQTFSSPVSHVFFLGKGVTYDDYRRNESNPEIDKQNLVPTWGWPASDNLLVSESLLEALPAVQVGRLAAISSAEVGAYLAKVRDYEALQQSNQNTVANKSWMKTSVHVVGANNNINLENILSSYQNGYAGIISDTFFGARVEQFNRLVSGPVSPATNARMEALFNSGIGILNYFGHSSATALDYNINDPNAYNNTGKYPVFVVNGCNAGNFFSFDPGRFINASSLAERFVLAPQKGAIAFLASTHFGVTSFLDALNVGLYRSLARTNYGATLGVNMRESINYARQFSGDSLGLRLHLEENTLHGDPALRVNSMAKPDFVVEDATVSTDPSVPSIADPSFTLRVRIYNLGKALGDSVGLTVRRQYPNGQTELVLNRRLQSIRFLDSLSLVLPILPSRDRGETRLTVSVDPQNAYDEMSEGNNVVTKTFFLAEDDVKPIYPLAYQMLTTNSRLSASTASPLAASRSYLVEMDTTEAFNSSFKRSQTITQSGGVVEYSPGISFVDSTVYYWRVATAGNNPLRWTNMSFQYVGGNNAGFSQAHFWQHRRSTGNQLEMDSSSRRWRFLDRQNFLQITHSVFGTSGFEPSDFQIALNGSTFTQSACLGRSIIFNVIDPVSLKPYFNQAAPSTTGSGVYGGFMGSATACQQTGSNTNFEFGFWDSTGRRRMRDFMDWIPNNAIVTARLILDQPYAVTPWAANWRADEAVYGVGNTFYARLRAAGFNDLDSFYYPRTWVFTYKKNGSGYATESRFTNGLFDKVIFGRNFGSPDSSGTITSPAFGLAKNWKRVQWQFTDVQPTDNISLQVIGVAATGVETVLHNLGVQDNNFDLSGVNASQFPSMKLRARLADASNLSPAQLRFWRVTFDPLPEGALAANVFNGLTKDTLEVGEPYNASIVFKNVSDVAFADSLSVTMTVQDAANNTRSFAMPKLKKLGPGDTVMVRQLIDTRNLVGNNTLFLEVNPNLVVPEQQRFNNLLYKNFTVTGDAINPLLEVTFDGVHILNNDIVNAKPRIVAQLKDNARFLLLDDTSLVTVQLRLPGGQLRRFAFGTDTLRFVPATAGAENSARIEFNPVLLADGDYELYIRGRDKSNNNAGVVEYRVGFKVINKPMISQLFNYPNPFTTSTAFVFTLTGSEVPQNLRIQILTVTGKIVKEITKAELGDIRIGRNITDYKWDGTDQYGQALGNGVYLYRVVTNLNGKSLDRYQTVDANGTAVNTDQYFNAGYGKMYLMR